MGKIIDVSYWQGQIDWSKAHSELDLVIMRASCGNAADGRFPEYAKACQKYKVPFGVYHYMMSRSQTALLNEIKMFYNTAKAFKPAFWVLDVEDPALLYANGKSLPMRSNFTSLVKYAYDELRKRVGASAKIVYYGGESVYEPYGGLSTIPWDALWIANYGKNTGTVTSQPKMKHDLHQYTSRGKVSGINTNVDLSRLMGDKPLSWWTSGQTEAEKAKDKTETAADTGKTKTTEKTTTVSDDVNPDINGDGKYVKITAEGTWNIRCGPGADFESLGLYAKSGDAFDFAAMGHNGWVGIFLSDGSVGFVTPQAATVVAPSTDDLGKISADEDRKVEVVQRQTWHIRTGPGGAYPTTGSVAIYTQKFKYAALACNNWVGVYINDKTIGWITHKAVKVV